MSERFLCAIFGRQYQLLNVAELATLTDFARYYQALPAVSPNVHNAALKNASFWSAIIKDPCSVLVSAKTLRNEILFKDSFVVCLGPWSSPAYLKLLDEQLLGLASAAHAKICTTILGVQQELLKFIERVVVQRR